MAKLNEISYTHDFPQQKSVGNTFLDQLSLADDLNESVRESRAKRKATNKVY